MSLSKKEVDAVAHLARLDISDEMAEKMAGQLNQVLHLIAKLNELGHERRRAAFASRRARECVARRCPGRLAAARERAPERAGCGGRLFPRAARY